ncbi:helix-turn-helix domain-containing protein [Herbidospora daliensis]|uniref:helix-turn-helix domain-containing protein n=1 Tax=Herbidospora daliensis TaxID=295585 RepID=UPI00078337EC|nr:helix-turn-helix transcriptional regulator [Herbidospora daliensis]
MTETEISPEVSDIWELFGRHIRHARNAKDLSLRQLSGVLSWHFSLIGKWERGINRPPAEAVERLDRTLEMDGRLVSLYAVVVELDQFRRRMLKIRPSASVRNEDDDMDRRAALRLMSALSAGVTVPVGTLETILGSVERSFDLRDDHHIDDWHRTVQTYGQLYYAQPPNALIPDLTADLLEVGRLLQDPRTGLPRNELLRVGSQLTALMATDFNDAGNRRSARLAWQTARRTADASADRNLAVWVRAREADCLFWQDQPQSMIAALLDDALAQSHATPSTGHAMALEVRAKLAALDGRSADAIAALNELTDTYERLPDHATTAGAIGSSVGTSYPEASVHRSAAYVYAFLADTKKSSAAIDRAIATYPSNLAGGNLRLIQALSAVHGGDLTHALLDALRIAEGVRQLTPMRQLIIRRIVDAVPRESANLPTVRELRALAHPVSA